MSAMHRQSATVPLLLGIGVGGLMLLTSGRRVLRVELPPDFRGNVAITCDTNNGVGENVIVNSHGLGTATACPKRGAPLVIMRAGKQVMPIFAPNWIRTENGVAVGVSFSVR
jgi:hypothetical protein